MIGSSAGIRKLSSMNRRSQASGWCDLSNQSVNPSHFMLPTPSWLVPNKQASSEESDSDTSDLLDLSLMACMCFCDYRSMVLQEQGMGDRTGQERRCGLQHCLSRSQYWGCPCGGGKSRASLCSCGRVHAGIVDGSECGEHQLRWCIEHTEIEEELQGGYFVVAVQYNFGAIGYCAIR
jgi:hypothetical protein